MSVLKRLTARQQNMVVLATGIVVSVLLILIAELGLRVRAYVKYGYVWGVESTFTIDQKTGLRVPVAGGEFGSIKINSLGFRGPELAPEKPENTVRLAFLGGSTTYSAEVSSPELTWPHLVTERLAREFPEVRLDYVNGGVPGYGLESSLANLRERVKPLDPDVILVYHATNDLSYNSYRLAVDQGIVAAGVEQDLFWLSEYSLLSYLVEKNLNLLARKREANANTGKLEFQTEDLVAPFDAKLRELTRASQEVADVVALITFSRYLRAEQTEEQKLKAAETSLYYMPYMTIGGLIDSFDAYNDVIRDVARDHGTLIIESEPHIPGSAEYFVDSVHFSDAGSRAMAEAVATGLAESAAFRKLVERIAGTPGRQAGNQ